MILFWVLKSYSILSATQGPPLVETFNLKQALLYAEQNSPDLEILRRELAIKRAEKSSAKYALYPHVNVHSSLSTGTSDRFHSLKVRNQVGLSVSENIYDNGKSLQKITVSSVALELAELTLNAEKEQLAFSLLDSFYDLSMNSVLKLMNDENLKNLQHQYNSIERSYKQGLKQQNDFLRIKVDVQNAQLRTNSARAQIEVIKVKLANLIGNKAKHDLNFETPRLNQNDFQMDEDDLDKTYKENLDKRISELKTRLELESLELQKKNYYPQVTASAFAGFENNLEGARFLEDRKNRFHTEIKVSVDYPLWDWGDNHREYSKALEREAITRENLRKSQNQIDTDISTLHINFKIIRDNYELNKSIDANSQKSFLAIQENYKTGKATYLDLANAFKDRLSSKENLIRSEFELALTIKKYLSMQGKLYEKLVH